MWFPSFEKLDAAIKILMARVGEVHLSTEAMLNESKMFDPVLGPAVELQSFYDRGEMLMGALMNLLSGLRSGAPVREVNGRLPGARAMVDQHEAMFCALRSARAAGAERADQYFEIQNAQN